MHGLLCGVADSSKNIFVSSASNRDDLNPGHFPLNRTGNVIRERR